MSFLKGLLAAVFSGRARGTSDRTPAEPVEVLIARIKAGAAPCVSLIHGAGGKSRLGGAPNLEGDWPRFQGRPMTFLAQLDLAEVRLAGGADWLPDRGLLLFFYELKHFAWGFDPKDAGSFQVIHVGGAAPPRDAPGDLEAECQYPEQPISFESSLSYPDTDRLGIEWRRLSTAEEAVFEAAMDSLAPAEPDHRIGGYPSSIQNDDQELQCQLVTKGVYTGKSAGYVKKNVETFKPGVADWRLLLQLDSDEQADMMWGDMGRLYFWIREQDARAGDFSKVWMILQCY